MSKQRTPRQSASERVVRCSNMVRKSLVYRVFRSLLILVEIVSLNKGISKAASKGRLTTSSATLESALFGDFLVRWPTRGQGVR
jgi:hypothetical protein